MLIHSDPNDMNSIVYYLIMVRYSMKTLHWYFPWPTASHLYNMTGKGEKLQRLHCYHRFSDSLDIYLTKNHYENYSPKMVPMAKIWGSGSWTNRHKTILLEIAWSVALFLPNTSFDFSSHSWSHFWHSFYKKKNRVKETAYTIVDWPCPKQWLTIFSIWLLHTIFVMMISWCANKLKQPFSPKYIILLPYSRDCTTAVGLLPHTKKCGLRMRRECRERFHRHRRLAIPTCITARAWCTCRDARRDR